MNYTKQDPNNYWEQLERLEKLIKASEFKAGVIFSFHSLCIGIYVDRLSQFESFFESSILFNVLALLWIISVLASIFYCFKCFSPTIAKNYPTNVFFFKDAANAFEDIDSYSETIIKVCQNENEFFTQLSHQIYVESKIIDRKFLSVNKSIKFLGISLIFLFAKIVFIGFSQLT